MQAGIISSFHCKSIYCAWLLLGGLHAHPSLLLRTPTDGEAEASRGVVTSSRKHIWKAQSRTPAQGWHMPCTCCRFHHTGAFVLSPQSGSLPAPLKNSLHHVTPQVGGIQPPAHQTRCESIAEIISIPSIRRRGLHMACSFWLPNSIIKYNNFRVDLAWKARYFLP